jgi:hypothetical protein
MWVAALPLSLRQADIFKAQDIPHSRPFMDSQRTTFSVRASTSLLSNSPEKEGLEFNAVLANGSFVTVNSASQPDRTISSLYSVMFLTSSFLQCSGLCVGVVLEAGVLL